ncbi:MAG: glucosaminidase domain-containing protein [Bacteroidales bacterium]|nr:glucosaminidase domain-containing protein [Bacteroidales bacterium]
MKKRLCLVLASCLAVMAAYAQTAQQNYIDKYAEAAVAEMYRSGVPASITLAQGLLESGAGLSEMAREGNNHFGIKCHNDWKGKTMYFDDDAKNECFRKYSSVAESYEDHSNFLRYKDRYKFLFDYETTDYKSWCYGLKTAGYATDPSYATKLIKIIEDYRLYEYDSLTADQIKKGTGKVLLYPGRKETEAPEGAQTQTAARTEKKTSRTSPTRTEEKIPESPLQMEQPEAYVPKASLSFDLSRKIMTQNKVPFVYAMEGETYQSIADQYNLFLKEILRFNDLGKNEELSPGTVVYIQKKKSSTARGLNMHIVDENGETLRSIAQRYGVTVKSLMKRNGLTSPEASLYESDRILLRK